MRLIFFLCISLLATPIFGKQIQVDWEYSEVLVDGGFRLYHQLPGNTEWTLIQDISGGELRTWTGEVILTTGQNLFVLTAYDSTNESPYSAQYPLDYIRIFNKPIIFEVDFQ